MRAQRRPAPGRARVAAAAIRGPRRAVGRRAQRRARRSVPARRARGGRVRPLVRALRRAAPRRPGAPGRARSRAPLARRRASTTRPARSRGRRACGSTSAAPGKGHVADLVAGAALARALVGRRLRRRPPASAARTRCRSPIRCATSRPRGVARPRRRGRHLERRRAGVARRRPALRAHHLLDPAHRPSRRGPGCSTATAFAPTTLEAETLAKVALLCGPAARRRRARAARRRARPRRRRRGGACHDA